MLLAYIIAAFGFVALLWSFSMFNQDVPQAGWFGLFVVGLSVFSVFGLVSQEKRKKTCPSCKSTNTTWRELGFGANTYKVTCNSCGHVYGSRCPNCRSLASFSESHQTHQNLGGTLRPSREIEYTSFMKCNNCNYTYTKTWREMWDYDSQTTTTSSWVSTDFPFE